MSISQRIIFLIAVAMACLAVLVGVGHVQMSRVYDQANYGNEHIVPTMETLHRAVTSFDQIRVLMLYHILSSHMEVGEVDIKAEIQKKIDEAFTQTKQALKDYESRLSNEEDRQLLEADRAALEEYKKSIAPALSASN